MRYLVRRLLLLVPVTLTFVPAPEAVLSAYFLVPSTGVAFLLFVIADAVSAAQLLYQYWAVGEIRRLAPGTISSVDFWLERQLVVIAIRRHTPLTLFLLGLSPGFRTVGVGVWRGTGYPWGGYLLMAGTTIQLGGVFAILLGMGKLARHFVP